MVSETKLEEALHVVAADVHWNRDDFRLRLTDDQHRANFAGVAGLWVDLHWNGRHS
jgi:hypothetical protein